MSNWSRHQLGCPKAEFKNSGNHQTILNFFLPLCFDSAVPWKNTHVGSPKGNHYTRAPSPAQGLTFGNVRVLDLASGAPPHLTAEGVGGTSTGFAVGN